MTVISLILVLVVLPAVVGFCLYLEYVQEGLEEPPFKTLRRIFRHHLESGDPLIYRKQKTSARPGPRALNVQAAEHGDDYSYDVDKFWVLDDVLDDGRLVAVTRTGKRVFLTAGDERLRRPGFFERLRYRGRFPAE